MLINQKRIRTVDRHLPAEYRGQPLRFGHTNVARFRDRLAQVGFSSEPQAGEEVLPAIVGPATRFNAEGKQVVRRDLKKETASRQIEWHWTEYHGKDQVEKSDFKYISYERYPRDFIPPPSIELQILTALDGTPVALTHPVEYIAENSDAPKNAINLCLEVFRGECEVLTTDLKPIIHAPITRLNWRVLPPGRYPWDRLVPVLAPVIEKARRGNQGVIRRRLQLVNDAGPEFVAVGNGGFAGYLVFGFPAKGMFVLESAYYGNATYVFDEDWAALSQMSKAQILDNNLQRERILHREGWSEAIRRLLF